MKVKFEDFKIIPDIRSVRKEEINDETYFSKAYGKYISNSRLNKINPKRNGSPEEFVANSHDESRSLDIGTAVHEILLQPESFVLGPKMGRPSAKLGDVIDEIWINRCNGESIYDSIYKACKKVNYYSNSIDKKIRFIIEKGLPYYLRLSEPRSRKEGVEEVMLCDRDYNVVHSCLEACYNNKDIMDKLHPVDVFGDPIESHCEDALFIDFIVTYKDKQCAKIPFKLKIDNWTIDFDQKVVTLNDLKTSGKPLNWFMNPDYGSFVHYNYYRQLYVYLMILWYYCEQRYGVSKVTGWTSSCNILAVQTREETNPKYSSEPYPTRCFNIGETWLKKGKLEFEMLMKRVAAYEIFGWENQINFV